jgi:NADPH:quinone reductase-like Zn-dependent oxidoreductase
MRAAILRSVGGAPEVGDFDEPDHDTVVVTTAGCNPVDLALASGALGRPRIPSVVGKEGVGVTADAQRVYFDSPPAPFGSWAQRCQVDPQRTFPVPEGLGDELAVAMGIAGLAAWLPLTRHATVTSTSSVLVLGATGVVGSIAVQAAALLGAGRVIAAGRDRDALHRLTAIGADATVALDGKDDARALAAEAGGGYDIVLDTVYGPPFVAALENAASRATLVTVGQGAGSGADIEFQAMMGRTHIGHYNDAFAPDELRTAYAELAAHAGEGRIVVDFARYPLGEAAEAFAAQKKSPHRKIVITP